MEAADESKRRGGAAVSPRDVLVKAGCPEKWLPRKPVTEASKESAPEPGPKSST